MIANGVGPDTVVPAARWSVVLVGVVFATATGVPVVAEAVGLRVPAILAVSVVATELSEPASVVGQALEAAAAAAWE